MSFKTFLHDNTMSLFLKHAATHSFFLSSSSLLSSGLTSPNAANFARLLQTETRLQSWAALPLASRQQVIKMIGPDHAAAPRRRQEPAEAEAADAAVLVGGAGAELHALRAPAAAPPRGGPPAAAAGQHRAAAPAPRLRGGRAPAAARHQESRVSL